VANLSERYPTTRAARWLAGVAVMLASATFLGSVASRAACLPLPDSELSHLDAQVAVAPERALREADDELAREPRYADPLLAAQLYAVIAASNAHLDRTGAARAAIAKGIELLQSARESDAAARVRLRLELLDAELQSTSANAAAARATIDKLLTSLGDASLDRACALSQRAIAYDFSGEPDRAVNDALIAYRLATDHGWSTPQVESVYTLAVNFRRAGLYERAKVMIDEVIDLETAGTMHENLPQAYYERGNLLVSMGSYPEARHALELSKQYAIAAGDPLTAAAANIPLCLADIKDHDIVAADLACNAGEAQLIAGNRPDLAMLLQSYQARLDLERHRPDRALAKLDKILSGPIHQLLPVQEAQLYNDRGRAKALLHRYGGAFADLAHAQALDADSGIEDRHRRVAVMSALIESVKLRASNRVLEQTLKSEQNDVLRQKKARLLWAAVAVTSLLVCGLLACLLLVRKQHLRRLRRYDIILNHAWSRAPHAMLMLDENRLVCFANRPLVGAGPAPVVGASLSGSVPPDQIQPITQAVDRAVETGHFQSLELVVQQNESADRHYDVLILPAIEAGETLGVALQSIDVTDLRAMERQFLNGASRERLQLGGELHEGLAQELAGVLLMLSSLSTTLQRESPQCAHLMTEAAEQLARSINSARRMAQDLAPVRIERGSLANALQKMIESAAQQLGIVVSCECALDGCAISDVAADQLYLFCRDALIEVALIEHCHRICIRLRSIDDSLAIHVSGHEQRPIMRMSRHEFPTRMMVFRARLLGGSLRVGPESDTEFCITLTVPSCRIQDYALSDTAPASLQKKPYAASDAMSMEKRYFTSLFGIRS